MTKLTNRSFWIDQGLLLLALTLITLSYLPDGLVLWNDWSSTEEFSHGPLMLAVALYLLWKRRAIFLAGSSSHSWFGLVVILVAAVLYVGSIKAAIIPPRHYAFIMLIYGLVLFAGGRKFGGYVLPSLVLLVFVIPPPGAVSIDMTAGLQLFSSDMSVALLRAVGVTVFQDGNIIDLGVMKLEVAEACAGLRYLYPMMGLGVLIGMLFDISWIKRALFLIVASLTSVFMNVVRIFLTGIVADMTDLGVSEGFFHLFEGWIFFLVTFSLTLALCRLFLTKKEWDTLGRGYFVVETTASEEPSSIKKYSTIGLIFAILIMVLGMFARTSGVIIPERSAFISFPQKLDGRVAKKQQLTKVEQDVLRMTDYFLGNYEQADSPPISLFIGYFEAQSKGQAPHSPKTCIPGGGWEITSMQTIAVPHGEKLLPVNRVVIAKGKYRQLVYYWFQQGANSFANSYAAKIDILWRGIVSSRTDGALVRLVLPVGEDISEEIADALLTKFTRETLKVLPEYVPN